METAKRFRTIVDAIINDEDLRRDRRRQARAAVAVRDLAELRIVWLKFPPSDLELRQLALELALRFETKPTDWLLDLLGEAVTKERKEAAEEFESRDVTPADKITSERLLVTGAVAQLTGYSVSTIDKLIKLVDGPPTTRAPGTISTPLDLHAYNALVDDDVAQLRLLMTAGVACGPTTRALAAFFFDAAVVAGHEMARGVAAPHRARPSAFLRDFPSLLENRLRDVVQRWSSSGADAPPPAIVAAATALVNSGLLARLQLLEFFGDLRVEMMQWLPLEVEEAFAPGPLARLDRARKFLALHNEELLRRMHASASGGHPLPNQSNEGARLAEAQQERPSPGLIP
jgi:hypothetical protein